LLDIEGRSGRVSGMKTHITVGVQQHVMGSIWNFAYDVST
jgi:hypothetical protein